MAYISVIGVVVCDLDVEESPEVRDAQRSVSGCVRHISAGHLVHQ